MTKQDGHELKQFIESRNGAEPIKVKCLCRFVDLKVGIDEDRWFTYTIKSVHDNCFFATDGRSRPWWAVKDWKVS